MLGEARSEAGKVSLAQGWGKAQPTNWTGGDGQELLKRVMPRVKMMVATVNDDVKTAMSALRLWAAG
jgi:hypothetical protein